MAKAPTAFRTISEVAKWLGTQAHVLRFWESKFKQIAPVKRAGGRRYYRPEDMLLIGGIKKLLHDDGLTIKGVQKLISEQGVDHVSAMSPELVFPEKVKPTKKSKPKPKKQEDTVQSPPQPEMATNVVPFTMNPLPTRASKLSKKADIVEEQPFLFPEIEEWDAAENRKSVEVSELTSKEIPQADINTPLGSGLEVSVSEVADFPNPKTFFADVISLSPDVRRKFAKNARQEITELRAYLEMISSK